MSSVNKVIIIGNLGADPEVRTFPNGGKVCNMRVATSETWKDKQTGERKERTEWHSVAIFNEALADLADRYLKKGSKVYLEGQLETRKWQDKFGADRFSTEIVLRPFRGEMTFLDGKPGEDDRFGTRADGDRRQERGGYDQSPQGTWPGNGKPAAFDDDIPFAPEFR